MNDGSKGHSSQLSLYADSMSNQRSKNSTKIPNFTASQSEAMGYIGYKNPMSTLSNNSNFTNMAKMSPLGKVPIAQSPQINQKDPSEAREMEVSMVGSSFNGTDHSGSSSANTGNNKEKVEMQE